MKTLIRVQDSKGTGMFQSGMEVETSPSVYQIDGLEDLALRHRQFPTTKEDKTIFRFLCGVYGYDDLFDIYGTEEFKYRFSFKNLTQFEQWVKRDEIAILVANGYRVYKIEADVVEESEFQCIFNIDSVISQEDITNLFLD